MMFYIHSFLTAVSSLELQLSGTSKTQLNHVHSYIPINILVPTSAYYAIVLLYLLYDWSCLLQCDHC